MEGDLLSHLLNSVQNLKYPESLNTDDIFFFCIIPAESFAGKGVVIKGIRRHARMRVGKVSYRYTHYFVRLEEGEPPKDFYGKERDPDDLLEKWINNKRNRKFRNTL